MIPKLAGHRGCMASYPENTLTGLRAALAAGACFIEFDVQMTVDHQLVLLHDDTLARTAGRAGSIFDLTLDQLDGISVHEAKRLGEKFAGEPLPTLQQALALLAQYPAATALVEIKEESLNHFGLALVMNTLIKQLQAQAQQCVVISFSYDAMQYIREHSAYRMGWVLSRYDKSHRQRAETLKPEYLICNYKKIPRAETPWPGSDDCNWQWMLYDIDKPELALKWAERGVAIIETPNIDWMLQDPKLKQQRCALELPGAAPTDTRDQNSVPWDLVVIGAGIHGAGIAQAAAAAGYKVLLLEQFDGPAHGTSSRSSKLIHGGLRYLETAQFHLVYESLVERRRLLANAPHLVKLKNFYIPVYKNTARRPWQIFIGLCIYALFSGKKFRHIPKREWHTLDGLKTENLDAVFSYYDAQTDDAKLTSAVLSSAKALGAEVIFGAHVEKVQYDENGCVLDYCRGGELHRIKTQIIVNATGPWVNDLLDKVTPRSDQCAVDLIQGTHIVVPGTVKQAFYLESPTDQRAVFVLPWQGNIMIGTTENNYTGDPAKVQPLDSEIDYLLEIYKHYFLRDLKPDDLIESFAGLRVLPHTDSAAFSRRRGVMIQKSFDGKAGIISLYGGKLTAYRATAEDLMRRLYKVLPNRKRKAKTRNLRLPKVK